MSELKECYKHVNSYKCRDCGCWNAFNSSCMCHCYYDAREPIRMGNRPFPECMLKSNKSPENPSPGK